MSEMIIATVSIEGTRTLLWNAFNISNIPREKKVKTGVAGNDSEEWRRTVLATDTGKPLVQNITSLSAMQNYVVQRALLLYNWFNGIQVCTHEKTL